MQETVFLVRFNFLLLLIILISSANLLPQVYPDERVDFLLKTGINFIVKQDYDQSKLVFASLDNEFPALPLGKIYLAATSIAESYDYAEEFDEDFILDNLDEAKEQSKKLVDSDTENISELDVFNAFVLYTKYEKKKFIRKRASMYRRYVKWFKTNYEGDHVTQKQFNKFINEIAIK